MTDQQASLAIGIIGCGAIGSVFAYTWSSHNCFHASMDPCYRGAIQRKFYDQTQAVPSFHNIILPAWQGQTLDWLVITTKAAETLSAMSDIAPLLSRVERIVLIQNGMGQQEQVANWLSSHNATAELWVGTTTNGAYHDDGTIYYTGAGDTFIGPFSPHSAFCSQMLPLCAYHENPLMLLREKLAINAVINPLTAQAGCLNGELITNPVLKTSVQRISTEVTQLYQQLGWPLSFDLYDKAIDVVRKTSSNRSSTLQDIEAGRTTELAYITGYLLDIGQHHKIALPTLALLHSALTTQISPHH